MFLNHHNYGVLEQDMETFIKSKGLWQSIKIAVLDPNDRHQNLVTNKMKDEAVGVIVIYISREIHFHESGINYLNNV